MNVNERAMESRNSSRMCGIQFEDNSETQAWQTMEESHSLLHYSMVHSGQTEQHDSKSPQPSAATINADLAISNPERCLFGQTETETGREQEYLEVSPAVQCAGVADPCHPTALIRNLRPSELVRLLNSTLLGEVINDRQLHRHRSLGPWIESSPKQIDLLKYVVWLQHKRSSRRLRTTQRKKHSHVITTSEAEAILNRQSYRCALSGMPLTPDDLALDHIVPVSEGGDFSASNAQFVTKTVNRAKHTMSQQEFILMCRRIASHQHSPKPVSIQGQQRTLWE
jgi:5-methylcytosine-specific restriction endonuclease McrA